MTSFEIDEPHAYLFDVATLTRRRPRGHTERGEIHEGLRSLPFAASMCRADLRALAKSAHTFSFPAHWTVLQQSGIADVCLLLREGVVRFLHNGTAVGTAGPGEILGLTDAVERRVHHNAAVSATRVRGIAVESEALLAALASCPEFSRTTEISFPRFAAVAVGT